MPNDDRPFGDSTQFRLNQEGIRPGPSRPGPLGRLLAAMGWAVLLFFAFTFSLVLFVVLVAAGLLVWAYLWWKTRGLRRQMREQQEMGEMRDQPSGGRIIEGEVIRD